jgi:hypothetical protein
MGKNGTIIPGLKIRFIFFNYSNPFQASEGLAVMMMMMLLLVL